MTVTLIGRPISKKNSRRMVRGRYGKMFPMVSLAYQKWERDALNQLIVWGQTYGKLETYDVPVRVEYIFHMKGKLDSDGDNMEAGVNDILEKAGILKNDKLIREWSGKKISGCHEFQTEIIIVPLQNVADGIQQSSTTP